MARSTDRLRLPHLRPSSRRLALNGRTLVAIAIGYLALVLGAIIALSLAAPTVNATEGGVGADGALVVVVGDGVDARTGATVSPGDIRRFLPASPVSRGSGSSVTPPPTDVSVGPGPAFPLLPGWGWVVLGLICFSVVLGLVWPEDRDPRG